MFYEQKTKVSLLQSSWEKRVNQMMLNPSFDHLQSQMHHISPSKDTRNSVPRLIFGLGLEMLLWPSDSQIILTVTISTEPKIIKKKDLDGLLYFSQFSSVSQLCLTLLDPMDCSTPGFPIHHQLLELAQTHVIKPATPFNHLILCHPLLSCLTLLIHSQLPLKRKNINGIVCLYL